MAEKVVVELEFGADEIVREAEGLGYTLTLEDAEAFLDEYGDSIKSGLSHDGWERIAFYLEDWTDDAETRNKEKQNGTN